MQLQISNNRADFANQVNGTPSIIIKEAQTEVLVADGDTNDIHARRGAQVSVKSVLEALNIDADLPTVLLHHGPNGIKHANKAGVDLYLAGHTHAG